MCMCVLVCVCMILNLRLLSNDVCTEKPNGWLCVFFSMQSKICINALSHGITNSGVLLMEILTSLVPTPTSGTGLIITSVAASTYTSQPSSNHPTDATRGLSVNSIFNRQMHVFMI